MVPKSLKRYAWLSVAAALSTILLKGLAWRLTDSVGLLSDAIESLRRALPGVHVTTHLEPKEDPISHVDQELDRPPN